MTDSRFFIIEPAFYKRDKNHKFDNFKTILFFNEVAFRRNLLAGLERTFWFL